MSSDFSVLFKKFLFKIVTFAEQIKHGIDQVFVIQTFEFHFIQIEIFGSDPQDMNRFIVTAIGRIENSKFLIFVFHNIEKFKTNRFAVLVCQSNNIWLHKGLLCKRDTCYFISLIIVQIWSFEKRSV